MRGRCPAAAIEPEIALAAIASRNFFQEFASGELMHHPSEAEANVKCSSVVSQNQSDSHDFAALAD